MFSMKSDLFKTYGISPLLDVKGGKKNERFHSQHMTMKPIIFLCCYATEKPRLNPFYCPPNNRAQNPCLVRSCSWWVIWVSAR